MKSNKFFPTVALCEPLNGIRFIILADGTVYENYRYECDKMLKREQYMDIFNHCTTLLCGNIPTANYEHSIKTAEK